MMRAAFDLGDLQVEVSYQLNQELEHLPLAAGHVLRDCLHYLVDVL